ncbi:OprD family porin [Pseudomonas sp. CA3A]|uniref:OprD family porin n=1 Tax=Pseudomonas typographi TaxID=2715964 RepID=A0ABR7Z333_9PSED|nr:OprD family porin [Pseudomonas typographi]
MGASGLSFMGRYVKGTDIKTTDTDDGKAWESDLQVSYVVQGGPVKGLMMRVRQVTYRSDVTANANEVRVITEYPISIF